MVLLEVLTALFLVFINGFFVASEFALVRMRASSAEKLLNEGRFGAKTLNNIMKDLDDYLAVTQIGITIASLALGSIGEPAIADLIKALVPSLSEGASHGFAIFVVSFLIVTYLHVVFGELAAKTIAIQRAEKLSLIVAKPMKFFYYLFLPGIIIFNGSSNQFTRLIGIEPASETEEILEEEEIISILDDSNRKDVIDSDEVQMIKDVFELDDKTASDIMTKSDEVSFFEPTDTVEEMREEVRKSNHIRYPVLEDNKTIGFVDVRDITKAEEGETAGDIYRELPVVDTDMLVDDIIDTIQSKHSEILTVEDDGSFVGIVTSEDVVEQVVGDIRDHYDR